VSACGEAGVPFEVVPGVSSAVDVLAYAGIPVSDRRHGASFAVVTGHKDPSQVTADTRWEALGSAVDTVVILMGMRNLETIVARILEGGRDPQTPAAVVCQGTLPEQTVVEAPLIELVKQVRAAGLAAPGVVVIGDVVRLRRSLAWYERKPLFGMRVLVTRAREQAGELVDALRAAGARPQLLPMIRLVAPSDPRPADAALEQLANYDAWIFTSANAVRFFAERARSRAVDLEAGTARVFCVGPRTAEIARGQGLRVHGIPESRFDAEGLLAWIEEHLPPDGRSFLMPRAEDGSEVLPDGLRAAGGRVDAVAVYRSAPPELDPAALRRRLLAGDFQALTFTSPSTARHFAALLDPASLRAAARCWIACIGPVTAEALRREGLEPDVTSERASTADLVEALAEFAAEPGNGPPHSEASP
ncbi:MAG: uroporphyrinogen-III synthase, partial [Deltaproteobacteria bacterium]|nr:uroporphyrinogen-III synthase [Deltaproteobacteria bacterium]